MHDTQIRLSREKAENLTISEKLEDLKPDQLIDLFQRNEPFQQNFPGNKVELDPRTDDIVVFNPSRASRPRHKGNSSGCPICSGNSTPIIDIEDLSAGFSFINQNLFPAVFPNQNSRNYGEISGMHFVQWTTSIHNSGWEAMPIQDLEIVLKQLGRLEKYLLEAAFSEDVIGKDRTISIIKNAGTLSGGSIAHDHQQIIVSDAIPARIRQNQRYMKEHGTPFSQHLMDRTNPDLIVADLGEAVLLVPHYMRRPYDLSLVLKNVAIQQIYQLSNKEIKAVATGWKLAIQSIRKIMPSIGKVISYNVLTHNGPGAGLYFEFLPHSQPNGGFERLGLSICQASPQMCAENYKQAIQNK